MNSKAIADGIAARFVGITATNGTDTETVSAVASLPNQVGHVALLVYHPTGGYEYLMSKIRIGTFVYPVRLLRDPVNVPSRSDWLYAWFDALSDLVGQHLSLGLTYVTQALPVSIRIELDGENYAGIDGTNRPFDVVELEVQVTTNEVMTTQDT